jgi:hypothetical protein
MSLTQALDLIPAARYGAEPQASVWAPFYGMGGGASTAMSGTGRALYVGRNDTLALTLSVAEVDAAGHRLDVLVETAACEDARRWRAVGGFAAVKSAGMLPLTPPGRCDAWVRPHWRATSGAWSFGLTGEASVVLASGMPFAGSGVGPTVDMRQYRSLRLTLDATAVTGSLDVSVETSPNPKAPAPWRTVTTWPTVTAISTVDAAAVDLDRYVRVRYAVSVGGHATWTVGGVARLVLATPRDRAVLGISKGAFPELSAEDADEWLHVATGRILGPWAARYKIPLVAWGEETRKACVDLADALALLGRGTEPDTKLATENSSYMMAMVYLLGTPDRPGGWIDRVAAEKTNTLGIIDSTTPEAPIARAGLAIASDAPSEFSHEGRGDASEWFGQFGGST